VTLSASARRVAAKLEELGYPFEVKEFPEGTRSAEEAARAVGCRLGQIAKSLVFRGRESGRSVLVIASGANRVDEGRLAERLGEAVVRASPEFVRAATGFAIGGVPPVGHHERPATFVDSDLFAFAEIWAAAGTPRAVFRLTPEDLVAMTGGEVAALAEVKPG
jgi:prolyl-tRNA editing enzyme YbaK/EbsC (Cys-tRNA(Pro) deacylase)